MTVRIPPFFSSMKIVNGAVIAFTLCCGASIAHGDPNAPIEILEGSMPTSLGEGWSLFDKARAANSIIDVRDEFHNPQTEGVYYELAIEMTTDESSTTFASGSSIDATVPIKIVTVSGGASSSHESTRVGKSIVVTATVRVVTMEESLKSSHFTPNSGAGDLLAGGKMNRFQRKFGTHFVSRLQRGGMIKLRYTYEFNSESERDAAAAALGVKVGSYGGSANVSSTFSRLLQHEHRTEQVCVIGTRAKPPENAAQVPEFINGFAASVDQPRVIGVEVRPYTEVIEFPDDHEENWNSALGEWEQLNQGITNLKHQLAFIDLIDRNRAAFLNAPSPQESAELRAQREDRLAALKERQKTLRQTMMPTHQDLGIPSVPPDPTPRPILPLDFWGVRQWEDKSSPSPYSFGKYIFTDLGEDQANQEYYPNVISSDGRTYTNLRQIQAKINNSQGIPDLHVNYIVYSREGNPDLSSWRRDGEESDWAVIVGFRMNLSGDLARFFSVRYTGSHHDGRTAETPIEGVHDGKLVGRTGGGMGTPVLETAFAVVESRPQ